MLYANSLKKRLMQCSRVFVCTICVFVKLTINVNLDILNFLFLILQYHLNFFILLYLPRYIKKFQFFKMLTLISNIFETYFLLILILLLCANYKISCFDTNCKKLKKICMIYRLCTICNSITAFLTHFEPFF